mmetsp:Transcript_24422/g.77068  ORF Transcript_24422/g.77068 Transcript_24422/m.77068 type:complete len:438 (+) Transcript_24422:1397-2710(+)
MLAGPAAVGKVHGAQVRVLAQSGGPGCRGGDVNHGHLLEQHLGTRLRQYVLLAIPLRAFEGEAVHVDALIRRLLNRVTHGPAQSDGERGGVEGPALGPHHLLLGGGEEPSRVEEPPQPEARRATPLQPRGELLAAGLHLRCPRTQVRGGPAGRDPSGGRRGHRQRPVDGREPWGKRRPAFQRPGELPEVPPHLPGHALQANELLTEEDDQCPPLQCLELLFHLLCVQGRGEGGEEGIRRAQGLRLRLRRALSPRGRRLPGRRRLPPGRSILLRHRLLLGRRRLHLLRRRLLLCLLIGGLLGQHLRGSVHGLPQGKPRGDARLGNRVQRLDAAPRPLQVMHQSHVVVRLDGVDPPLILVRLREARVAAHALAPVLELDGLNGLLVLVSGLHSLLVHLLLPLMAILPEVWDVLPVHEIQRAPIREIRETHNGAWAEAWS